MLVLRESKVNVKTKKGAERQLPTPPIARTPPAPGPQPLVYSFVTTETGFEASYLLSPPTADTSIRQRYAERMQHESVWIG
jgi:hypothetical protein